MRFLLRWLVVPLVALLAAVAAFPASPGAAAQTYDGEELEVLRLINEYRQQNGLEPLLLSDTLSVAAERHSEDMARYSFFAHDTYASSYYPAGAEPWDRMAAEGYDYNTYRGENIAVGYETAEAAFEAWRNSPSHNAAMLDGRYRVVGIGRLYDPSSAYGWYWTTDFGAVVDPSAHEPGEPPGRRAEKRELRDRSGIENGGMDGQKIWRQRAKDGARLILRAGYARLGEYDDGRDELSQRIRYERGARLSFRLRILPRGGLPDGDRLAVRLTDGEGRVLALLGRYGPSSFPAGRWVREDLRLPDRLAGRDLRLSFYAVTDGGRLTAFHLDGVRLRSSP
ncbi:hypothetical protein Rxycam_00324 [Rubrobacter xylanophilus DSM 9941]|uniref:CAP domain-containing protein n=1 Tax=Rubrobacter xylanophilus TaxID=49319 RepID=UPI001C641381|nr:CAP domain-containing protein [Rubrobacter xylanophilus]QYJ14528.1 hypothetical protein Rxycam_00324 [Rubrobacter xylanophilus DSM 9941]